MDAGAEAKTTETTAAEDGEDDSPKSIDAAGMFIIAFTIIPAFVGGAQHAQPDQR